MRTLIPIAFALFGIIASSALMADDIYVNNQTGDDNNNGAPATLGLPGSGPLRSIGKALKTATKGDRIIVQRTDQPYRESLSVQGANNSGTQIMPFEIVSDGAVIDGTQPVPVEAWEYVRGTVFRIRPLLMSHQQLYLDGRPAARVTPDYRDELPELQPTQWALVGGYIYFCTHPDRIPSQYNLSISAHQTGITLYQVRNVKVSGLVVQGFQLDGINAHDMVTNTHIQYCNLRGNGRSGLSIGGASRVRLSDSIVGDNYVAQLRSEGHAQLNVRNCRLLDSEFYGPPILERGGRIHVE